RDKLVTGVQTCALPIYSRCFCMTCFSPFYRERTLCLGGMFVSVGSLLKYSSSWRAASCSALFFVEPSARLTNSGLPLFSAELSLASTVNVLLCSGPCSFTSTYVG